MTPPETITSTRLLEAKRFAMGMELVMMGGFGFQMARHVVDRGASIHDHGLAVANQTCRHTSNAFLFAQRHAYPDYQRKIHPSEVA